MQEEEPKAPISSNIPTDETAIKEGLESVSELIQEIPRAKLSQSGQALTAGLQETIEDVERLLEEKQPMEPLQKSIAHAEEASRLMATETARRGLHKWALTVVDADQADRATQAVREGSQAMGKLAQMLVKSAEFRGILVDLAIVVQSIFAAQVEQASNNRSSKEEVHSENEFDKESEHEEYPMGKWPLLTDEQVEKLAETVKSVAGRIRGDPEIRQLFASVMNQFSLIRAYFKPEGLFSKIQQLSTLTSEERNVLEQAQGESQKSLQEARELVERWLDTSLEPVLENFNELLDRIANDSETSDLMAEMFEWIQGDLLEDKETSAEDIRQRLRYFVDRIRHVLASKYGGPADELASDMRFLADRLTRDPLARKLGDDLAGLLQDLFYDQEGKLTLKPDLLVDLQTVLPTVLGRLREIRLPEISIVEPDLSFHCSDIQVRVGEIVPKHIKISYLADLFPTTEEADEEANRDIGKSDNLVLGQAVQIEMAMIFGEAKNFRFSLDKRSTPAITDHGLADLRVGGKRGMSLQIFLIPRVVRGPPADGGIVKETLEKVVGEPKPEVPRPALHVAKCVCTIDELDLRLHQTKHE